MPIPTYESLMLPVLKVVAGGTNRVRDIVDAVCAEFGLSEEERFQPLPGGEGRVISNRVGWAKTYLKKAGLVDNSKRGIVTITEEGERVLATKPARIDAMFLERFDSFRDFIDQPPTVRLKTEDRELPATELASSRTPHDALAESHRQINEALADELLDQLKGGSHGYFEKVVVDLLVAMGYGGSRAEAGRRVGRSGDEGIDGIIDEDKLGLDKIVVQAKRYTDGVVGRPAIQGFAGSMEGYRARKGVFITTSTFSSDAKAYVERIERKIVLIDGNELTKLMIEHDVGVATSQVYKVKRIDTDYFDEADG